jgi:hypothetical protein
MSGEKTWNDELREKLRRSLRSVIVGELRLAKRGDEDIFEICRDAYINEECPERERDEFMQFAALELERTAAELASEQATWPSETDCDRLDRVETALRDRGIVLWQASPCCDTCTGANFPSAST